jgi:GTP-binding protein
MIIRKAVYVKGSISHNECPSPDRPEYAFIGRSNVGKSSLINMLTGQKRLARISSSPGKTQTIQHYLINDEWYMVDLPGFGYARVSRTLRERWQKMIATYLIRRANLMNTFVLIDSRIEPQAIDLDLVNWLGENQIPFVILFTKTDKTSQANVTLQINDFKKALKATWEVLPPSLDTSALTGQGKDEILRLIEETNRIFRGEARN